MKGVAFTGQMSAAMRAAENARPDRYIKDEHSALLVGEAPPLMEKIIERSPFFPFAQPILRTPVGDGTILKAAGAGVRQVVLLAAGMDTRAFRLALPFDTTVFELDLPEVFEFKDPALAAAGVTPVCDRRVVTADLKGDWTTPLKAAGLRPGRPVAWVIEGIFGYLEQEENDRLLDTLGAMSPAGSMLTFDALHPNFNTAPEMAPMRAGFDGQPYRLHVALEDPVSWLDGHGWRAEAYREADLADGLCAWAPVPPPRLLETPPVGWYVWAERR